MVLSQKHNGQTVVIAYASHRLKKHEQSMRNFSSRKVELLAMTYKNGNYKNIQGLLVWSKVHIFNR